MITLTVTTAAADKVLALGGQLRIELRQGGCCGTHYCFLLAGPQPGDIAIAPGIHAAPDAAQILQGARLDYGAHLKPPRFRVLKNPNTPHRCPCGRSFGKPWPGKETPQCQAYVPMPWDETELRNASSP
ncbi:MAG TPA: iron-sulfur cluster assembly accessory protein [Symbiobacteriaceae bacterium]|jgi:Fe-S cluster assembly iron-binding protein IscA|nr:iron-sulfur cluster assembly accessory protein [Symbiobacteriaceae bacterium]